MMNTHRNLRQFILITALLLIETQVFAHELKETRARVTLRDGQIEIRIMTDLIVWQTTLQNNQAWLMGDIDDVMPINLNVKQRDDYLTELLINKTKASINNHIITLDSASIYESTKGTHTHDIEIILTGKHNFASVDQVNIKFPKSLSVVHASFVKPIYKTLSPGIEAMVSF